MCKVTLTQEKSAKSTSSQKASARGPYTKSPALLTTSMVKYWTLPERPTKRTAWINENIAMDRRTFERDLIACGIEGTKDKAESFLWNTSEVRKRSIIDVYVARKFQKKKENTKAASESNRVLTQNEETALVQTAMIMSAMGHSITVDDLTAIASDIVNKEEDSRQTIQLDKKYFRQLKKRERQSTSREITSRV